MGSVLDVVAIFTPAHKLKPFGIVFSNNKFWIGCIMLCQTVPIVCCMVALFTRLTLMIFSLATFMAFFVLALVHLPNLGTHTHAPPLNYMEKGTF